MHEVIASGHFTMGNKVRKYEEEFASYFGSKFGVMSNSGSSANLLALAALKYAYGLDGERDEIIVPSVSWSTTYFPVHQLGFKLKFVDVNLNSLNMEVDDVARAITDKTFAIFAVNLLGNPADLEALKQLADQNGLFLIEDNCESMGAKVGSGFAGAIGHVGTFSSFFSHHISTMEGGMTLTDDPKLAQYMISLRAHGWTRELPDDNFVFPKTGAKFDDQFRFVLPGYNLRPLELEGAIGLEQLKKLPLLIEQRRKNASLFIERFHNKYEGVLLQKEFSLSSWFGFSLILVGSWAGHRHLLTKIFEKYEIEHRPIVAGNFTKNPVILHLNHVPLGPLPNANKIDVDGLFVGNHHYPMSDEFDSLEKALQEFDSQINSPVGPF